MRRRPWKDDLHQEFVRGEGGRVVAEEEVPGRDRALAQGAAYDELGVQQHREQTPFCGGVRVCHAAPDRAAGTDRQMPDPAHGPAQHLEALREGARRVPLHGVVGGECPDPQRPGGIPVHAVELPEAADVDEVVRTGQPEVHHSDQALSARDGLGVVTQLGQQPDGAGHVTGSVILKGRGLHGFPVLPCVGRPVCGAVRVPAA
ncbi:hypothetical protein GCM10009680_43760 [Streptomyces yatensis]|uniref:Uncharacterized protein n=1 Tax=Streptomyces yatensis TaxID=155177 RepID=A0ABN2I4X1_9ACTN